MIKYRIEFVTGAGDVVHIEFSADGSMAARRVADQWAKMFGWTYIHKEEVR